MRRSASGCQSPFGLDSWPVGVVVSPHPGRCRSVALIAALRGGPTAGRICAVIGAGVIVGTAIEPVTWSYTTLLNHIVMIGNLVSGAALIREGWRASQPETR